MLKGVLKKSASVFVFQIVSRGVSFLAFVLLARILGVEATGNFAYIISLSALLNLFVEFGTNQFLIRQVASSNEAIQPATILNIFLLKLSQFVIGIFLLLTIEYKALVTDFTFLNLTLCYVFFEGIAQIGISILNGQKRFVKANAFIFSYEITRSVLLLAFLFFTKDLRFVPLIYIFCALGYALIIFFFVLEKNFSIQRLIRSGEISGFSLFTYYKQTYLFFVAAIVYQLYFRVDMILLKRLSTPLELGIYSTAYKFFEVFLFVPAILSGIVFPYIVSLYTKSELPQLKAYVKDLQVKAVSLISVLVLMLIVLSDLIISVFFGKEFQASVQVMQLLFLTSFIYGLNFIYPVLFNATGNEKYTVYVFIAGFFLNFSLNYLFLPAYGAKAAAIITLISECVVTILYYLYLKKKLLELVHPKALMLMLCGISLGILRIVGCGVMGHVELSILVISVFALIMILFYRQKIRFNLSFNAKQ